MKLVFEKNNLVKAVDIVQKAVTIRTTMNILECILIDAESNCIKLTGNDLDLGIETTVEGEIIEKKYYGENYQKSKKKLIVKRYLWEESICL